LAQRILCLGQMLRKDVSLLDFERWRVRAI
jgi:hypothetical protein